MTTITFIRHTSVDVPRGVCYGRTDVPLASSFAEEAEAVRQRLQPTQFDSVFTSPLSRAVRLAAYCGYPHATKEARLLELDFGEWEMRDYDTLYHSDHRFAYWCEHYCNTATPHGESVEDQARRLAEFLSDLQARSTDNVDRHYAAFCHGGILAIALANSQCKPLHQAFENVPPYGSVVTMPLAEALPHSIGTPLYGKDSSPR